ncbi:MAG: trimethylamine methyltransferase family protein, partial [Anaerolineae bacterium]|nr:trimethylamine methyltransferase family protein [Anaerolineae bacterium]
ASAQMARYYGLPIRSVGGATESKREDAQAGFERMGTLLPAVLAGVNLITCAGTLDSTLLESHALLMLDDEIAGAAVRMARGIEVNDETLALDLIKETGFSGSYIAAEATSKHFRKELFIPKLFSREPYETWEQQGSKLAINRARERALNILAKHQPYEVDPAIARELATFKETVAARSLDEFYLYEVEEKQDFSIL